MTPIRIQRKRIKGWNMPENTISVTRPGEFGNPFIVGQWAKLGNGGNGFTYLVCCEEKYATNGFEFIDTPKKAVELYKEYLKRYPLTESKLYKIRGKNLACWCKVGDPCHADVLLKIANHPQENPEPLT